MKNTNQTFLNLFDRELRNAGDQWALFSVTRTEEAWCAYSAAHRRAHIVALSLGIDFQMGKPVIRVKANGADARRAA